MTTSTCTPTTGAGQAAAGRRDLLLALAGAAVIAASAQVQVPLAPFAIPFTLQAHTVLVLAALMGRRAAVGAVITYLLAGAWGAPVFAGLQGGLAHLVGPRAGYLLGFVPAAWWLGGAPGPIGLWRWLAGSAAILASGWLGLTPWLGAQGALVAGVAPFWLADAAKSAACYLGFTLVRHRRR